MGLMKHHTGHPVQSNVVGPVNRSSAVNPNSNPNPNHPVRSGVSLDHNRQHSETTFSQEFKFSKEINQLVAQK